MQSRLKIGTFIIVLCVQFFCNSSFGSYTKKDSLYEIWSDKYQADTTRMSALEKFIWNSYSPLNVPDSAMKYAENLLDFAKAKKNSCFEGKAYTIFAAAYTRKSELEKSLNYHEKSVESRLKCDDKVGVANALNSIGVLLRDLGDYDESVKALKESREIYSSLNNLKGVANTMNSIATTYKEQGDYEGALRSYEESMAIHSDLENQEGVAITLANIGVLYSEQSQYDKAIEVYQQSVEIREKLDGDKKKLAILKYNIGIVEFHKGDYSSCMRTFEECLAIAYELNEVSFISQILNGMGLITMDQGDLKSAIRIYEESLQLRKSVSDSLGIAQTLYNIGMVHKRQANYLMALDYVGQSVAIFRSKGSQKDLTSALLGMGALLTDMNDFDKALEILLESLEISKSIDDRKNSAIALNNLGLAYLGQKKFDSAISYFSESVQIREEIEDFQSISNPLNSLGEVFLQKKDFQKAIQYSSRALGFAQSNGQVLEIKESAKILHEAMKFSGDFKKSLEMHELYIQMRDSLNSTESIKELARFDAKLIFEKKALADSLRFETEKQHTLLNHRIQMAEKEGERNIYAFGGILLLVISFLFYQRKIGKARLKLKEKEAEHQHELLNATINSQEIERKRIARDLHDEVGAMLSTIKLNLSSVNIKLGQNGEQDLVAPARSLIDETINNVRSISKNLLPPTLEEFGLAYALEELAGIVEKATGIQIERSISQSITRMDFERELGVYRIVQEMMNNALKHSGASKFVLKLSESNNQINLLFEDNGKGFDLSLVKNSRTKNSGLGLRNLEGRANAISAEIQYNSVPNKGTSLILNMRKDYLLHKAA